MQFPPHSAGCLTTWSSSSRTTRPTTTRTASVFMKGFHSPNAIPRMAARCRTTSSSTATRSSQSAIPRRTWCAKSASPSYTKSPTSSALTTPVCTSSVMPEPAPESGLQILRSADRFTTEAGGIVTRHCFSFGNHYDPANVGFGALRAVNDEWLAPGAGYDTHHHADVEIVTWVLEGALQNEDS